jgi:hypothetical protein
MLSANARATPLHHDVNKEGVRKMCVTSDLNSGIRVLDAAEFDTIGGGCPCGNDCFQARLVHEGEQAPAGFTYIGSITNGAIFVKPGCLLN